MINRYEITIDKILVYLVVLACFSVPLGIAFISTFMGLFVIFWAFSCGYATKFNRIKHHPAAWVSTVLFLLYGIGMFYSSAEWNVRFDWWLKYHKLLYIPLIVAVFTTDRLRQFGLDAFLYGMVLVLAISYLKWLGVVPWSDAGQGYIVFKNRITYSIFMAFATYLMLLRVLETTRYRRWLWIILSALAGLNTFILVNGRTGQVILLVLLVWFCWEVWGKKSVTWMLVAFSLLLVIYQNIPDVQHLRLAEVRQEIAEHNPHGTQTSSGQRLEYYQNTFTLIKQHPLFGSGTGSFEKEYKELAEVKKLLFVHHPHNEFLLTLQELGMLGFFVLLLFWVTHWRASYQLTQVHYGVALRGLVITLFISSMLNSPLLDSDEGRFYCVLAGILLSAYLPDRKM